MDADSRKNQSPPRGSRVLAEKRPVPAAATCEGHLKNVDTMTTSWRWIIGLAAGLLALGGCATASQRPFATENVLSAAGFQMQLPDTPARLASLRTLPPRRVLPRTRDGHVEYVYADPTRCGCLYVGTEAQYQQYRRYTLEKQLADERLDAARTYGYGLDTWGEWGPWPLY